MNFQNIESLLNSAYWELSPATEFDIQKKWINEIKSKNTLELKNLDATFFFWYIYIYIYICVCV